MDHLEQDLLRCNELRDFDRKIILERSKLVANENEERSKLARLRTEYAQLHAELIRLQSTRAATAVGSAIQGVPGGTVGATAVKISIDIANIEPKIQDVKIRIAISEEIISGFQQNHDHLNRSQAENAQRMKNLNCVLP